MVMDKFFNRPFKVFLIILLLTLFSVLINSYYYGIGDSALRSTFIKSIIDKSLYKDDLFVSQEPYFYTFVHYALLPFYVFFGIENVSFFAFFIGRFFSYIAVFYLSKFLFKDNKVAMLSVFLLLIARPAMGGESFRSYYLEGELTLPILIFAFMAMIGKRYLLSSFLTGMAVNLHITTAMPAFGIILIHMVFNYKKIGIKIIARFLAVFLTSASPMLLWIYFHKASVQFFVSDFLMKLMKLIVVHHFFILSWFTSPIYIERWIRFFVFFAAYLVAMKYKPSVYKHKAVITLFFGLVILLFSTIIFTYIIPQPLIMNLQFFRSTLWISFFGSMYLSNYIVKEYQKPDLALRLVLIGIGSSFFIANFKALLVFLIFLLALKYRNKVIIAAPLFLLALLGLCLSVLSTFKLLPHYIGAFKLGTLPFYVILFSISLGLIFEIFKNKIKIKETFLFFSILFILIVTSLGAISLKKSLVRYPYFGSGTFEIIFTPAFISNPASFDSIRKIAADPRGYITHSVQYLYRFPRNGWEDIQVWASKNTNKDDIFITPPDMDGFRLHSERSTVGEWHDVILSTVNEDYAKKIWERMNDLCNSEIFGHCQGEYGYTCNQLCGDQYRKLDEKYFTQLARKYGAKYIVIEKPKALNFNLVYENNEYRAYRVNG